MHLSGCGLGEWEGIGFTGFPAGSYWQAMLARDWMEDGGGELQ